MELAGITLKCDVETELVVIAHEVAGEDFLSNRAQLGLDLSGFSVLKSTDNLVHTRFSERALFDALAYHSVNG